MIPVIPIMQGWAKKADLAQYPTTLRFDVLGIYVHVQHDGHHRQDVVTWQEIYARGTEMVTESIDRVNDYMREHEREAGRRSRGRA